MASLLAGPAPLEGGILNVNFTKLETNAVVNLSTEGAIDWVHWGLFTDSSINRKANVPPQIKDFSVVNNTNGFAFAYQYSDNLNGFSWQDGYPQVETTNTPTGVWVYGTPQRRSGFRFTAPATTNEQWLKVYVGAFAAQGLMTISLSDTSAAPYRSEGAEILSNISNGPGAVYAVRYAADSSSQELIVTYTLLETQGPDESTGNVTLQAAVLSAPEANNPPFAMLTIPTNNTSAAAFNDVTLSATASDLDGTVSLVEFFEGTNKIGESIGPDFSSTWQQVPRGRYVVRARVTDDLGDSRWSSPATLFVHGNGGLIDGASGISLPSVNLTSEGSSDWAHWGLNKSSDFNHKATGGTQITRLTSLGTNAIGRYVNNLTFFAWEDGTPTNRVTSTGAGVLMTGLTNGFEFSVPAGTNLQTLRVYASRYSVQANFQAWLSDLSAPAFTDEPVTDVYGNAFTVYTLRYRAAESNQRLHIRYTILNAFDLDYGNAALHAATLDGSPAPIPLLLREPSFTEGTFSFWFRGEPGKTYAAQFRDDPDNPVWQDLTNVTGTGASIWIFDEPMSSNRFYRVWTP